MHTGLDRELGRVCFFLSLALNEYLCKPEEAVDFVLSLYPTGIHSINAVTNSDGTHIVYHVELDNGSRLSTDRELAEITAEEFLVSIGVRFIGDEFEIID